MLIFNGLAANKILLIKKDFFLGDFLLISQLLSLHLHPLKE